MKGFLRMMVVAAAAAGAAACGGGEDGAGASGGPVALDLGEGGTPAATGTTAETAAETAAGGDAPGDAAPAAQASEASTPQGAPAEGRVEEAGGGEVGGAAENALVELDRWHRAPAARRGSVSGSGEGAAELAALAQLWTGRDGEYRSRVRLQPVEVFGTEYAALSEAFAEGGTASLEQALGGRAATGPVRLVWLEVLARQSARLQEPARAGRALGRWIPAALDAGYERTRVLEVRDAVEVVAEHAEEFLPFEEYTVQSGDSYWQICHDFRNQGMPLNSGWVKAFNGRIGDNIRLDETLKIPTATLRMDIWRDARLAAVSADGHPIRLYEISVGKKSDPTPLGEFTVRTFEREPVYYEPGAAPVPYGNPDNPLGERWLGFEEDPQYGLHGTNSEETIGSFESGGCVRFHNAEVIELFDLLAPGVAVTIRP